MLLKKNSFLQSLKKLQIILICKLKSLATTLKEVYKNKRGKIQINFFDLSDLCTNVFICMPKIISSTTAYRQAERREIERNNKKKDNSRFNL